MDKVSEEIENDIRNFLENKTIKNFKEFVKKYNIEWVDAIDIFTYYIIGLEVETYPKFSFKKITKTDEVNEIKKQRRKIIKETYKCI